MAPESPLFFCALNIFFRQTEEAPTNLMELEAEDFRNGTLQPVEITLTFHDLKPEAQADFSEYYPSASWLYQRLRNSAKSHARQRFASSPNEAQ
ncbi:hypothetical protein ABIB00_003723 [Bradyrhizobium sp. LB14.3]|uniref:hypothetical protein n=1 Tax=Bradyrhizobium sp. LB14.3 TaxID=3156328 RepID=UPI003399CAC2